MHRLRPRPTLLRHAAWPALALLLVLLGAGCSRKIGDECKINTDCSPLGERYCDIGSPGGYCTTEGCDHGTCPDDAVCVRFFTLRRGDPPCPFNQSGACRPGELCLCAAGMAISEDPSQASCTGGTAYCTPESTERRYCMKGCNADSDCRDGYICQESGKNGAILVPYADESGRHDWRSLSARYCAPKPQ
jgi:hypothetical protein